MMCTSDWIALFSLIISSSIAFVSLIVSGITAFYAYKVYQATQAQLLFAKQSAKSAEETANKQLELARQDADNSAEAAKQQKFVSCVEIYITIYNKINLNVLDIKGIDYSRTDLFNTIERAAWTYKNKNNLKEAYATVTKPIPVDKDYHISDEFVIKRQASILNKFICNLQPFINAVLILEEQLSNQEERNKFYCIVSVYSSNFIELFEMVSSLENYTPTNQTAFDNTQRVFNALQNKKQ